MVAHAGIAEPVAVSGWSAALEEGIPGGSRPLPSITASPRWGDL